MNNSEQAVKQYILVSAVYGEYGPFPSIERAWKYYFGRESSDEEREKMAACGWTVTPLTNEQKAK